MNFVSSILLIDIDESSLDTRSTLPLIGGCLCSCAFLRISRGFKLNMKSERANFSYYIRFFKLWQTDIVDFYIILTQIMCDCLEPINIESKDKRLGFQYAFNCSHRK